MTTILSHSAQETFNLGRAMAQRLDGISVLALIGNLGCGKTHFVQGLAAGLNITSAVRSPTFALIQEYRQDGCLRQLCHADLYRLDTDSILALGLEEYWAQPQWILAIEWADKIDHFLPSNTRWIRFEALDLNTRRITIE